MSDLSPVCTPGFALPHDAWPGRQPNRGRSRCRVDGHQKPIGDAPGAAEAGDHAERWQCINIRDDCCRLGRGRVVNGCGELLITARRAADLRGRESRNMITNTIPNS